MARIALASDGSSYCILAYIRFEEKGVTPNRAATYSDRPQSKRLQNKNKKVCIILRGANPHLNQPEKGSEEIMSPRCLPSCYLFVGLFR